METCSFCSIIDKPTLSLARIIVVARDAEPAESEAGYERPIRRWELVVRCAPSPAKEETNELDWIGRVSQSRRTIRICQDEDYTLYRKKIGQHALRFSLCSCAQSDAAENESKLYRQYLSAKQCRV